MRYFVRRTILCLVACLWTVTAQAAAVASSSAEAPRAPISIDQVLPGLQSDAFDLRLDYSRTVTTQLASSEKTRFAADSTLKKLMAAQRWDQVPGAARARIALGDADIPQPWLDLAEAELKRGGPPKTALEAAYLAYTFLPRAAHDQNAIRWQALDLMREALAKLHDQAAELRLLQAITAAYPDDQATRARLKNLVDTYGFTIRHVDTDPQSFPARACLAFTVALPHGGLAHLGDYVTTKPTIRDLAVTENGGKLCLVGLTPGKTITVVLHPGLPGIADAKLKAKETLLVTLTNRKPTLVADPSHYIIPASNPPSIGFSDVNVSKVKVKIERVSERSLLAFLASHPLLNQDMGSSNFYFCCNEASTLNGQNAPVIYSGSSKIPGFVPNKLLHVVIPLAKVMKKPGLYAVSLLPGDGTPNHGNLSIVQLVLRTNIAPTTWRGTDGLTAQLRRFTDATPIKGARIALIASDNAILATATTDVDGVAHFTQPLLNGPGGQAPAALHITGPNGDFTLVDLRASPFDLTDRGVSGRPVPKPIDPYIWLDRGIYRPGETVHVGVLLRSPSGKPLSVPLHLIVHRPGGQVLVDRVTRWTDDSSLVTAIHLPSGAQAGTWSIDLATSDKGPSLGQRTFTVAGFVPARLAVDFNKLGPLAPGKVTKLPLGVRFLYGAPGADLTGTAAVRIITDPTPFPAFKDYSFGLHQEIVNSPMQQPVLPETDASGATSVPIDLTNLPDATHALQAKVTVTINDPSGRSVGRSETLKIAPAGPLLGIRPDFADGTVNTGAKAGFDLVAIAPNGHPVAMKVDVSLVRQDFEWSLIWNDSLARWRYTYINRKVLTRTIVIKPGTPYHLELRPLPWGRYRLRLVQHSGGYAASSTIFYSGWASSSKPGVPTRLSVARDKKDYADGSTAHLHITAPFAGKAVLLIANDHLLAMKDFDLHRAGTDLDVPVSAKWGAGAYAIVEAYRPAANGNPPDRAIGLTWLGVKPGKRKLPVVLDVRKLYRPGRDVSFAVKTAPGAYVTLDAVDEGILSLTNFVSPDPLAHFFGKRMLGLSIADDYGALLRLPSGRSMPLHVGGGGNFGPSQPPIPQKIVSLFAGPVKAGPDGIAHVTLHLPDFNGQIRLMAVAWKEDAVGSEATDIISRHRLIADLLLPRFLSPGDNARIGVMLQDLDLPSGSFSLRISSSGTVTGADTVSLDLKRGARQTLRTNLVAKAIGTGHVDLDVSGPDGYTQHRTRAISVHVVRVPVTHLADGVIPPGGTTTFKPDVSSFISGSTKAVLTIGSRLPFDPAGYLQELRTRGLPFLEESVSRGLPLTALTGPTAGPNPKGRLAKAVEDVLDDQRFDGAFGLWSSQENAQPWLTAYATNFLLRARKAGVSVPNPPLQSALGWLRREVDNDPSPTMAKIYAAYVLALSGQPPAGAIRVMDNDISKVRHPLARAQLGAALAMIGEPDNARQAFQAALRIHNRGGFFWWRGQDWMAGYGTPLRDAWAVPALIRETGLLREDWPVLASDLPGKGLSPDQLNDQELAFAALAAADFAGKPETLSLAIDGKPTTSDHAFVRPMTSPLRVVNEGDEPVPTVMATTGIPATPQKGSKHGMKVHVSFYTKDGAPLDVSRLDQNTVFVMVISGRGIDSTPHHAILTAGLPAGWELAGNISSGNAGQMSWIGTLTTPRARAAADDRYMAAFTLYPPCSNIFSCRDNGRDQEFRTAVLVRAVTQGTFTLPGATLVDLYHPLERASLPAGTVTILPPGAPLSSKPSGHAAADTKTP